MKQDITGGDTRSYSPVLPEPEGCLRLFRRVGTRNEFLPLCKLQRQSKRHGIQAQQTKPQHDSVHGDVSLPTVTVGLRGV
jgi:hypothetical protein